MLPAAIRALYPPQCMGCGDATERDFALCGACWHDTPFLSGLVCDACGAGLPGQADTSTDMLCDDCLRTARPWIRGRAALAYRDNGRRFALQLKHGDRTDLARPLAAWMASAVRPIITSPVTVVPVPLHRSRLFTRRFNQAALLGKGVARGLGALNCPDALLRTRRTPPLKGMTRDERFREMLDVFEVNRRRVGAILDQDILLVDDVMTTGATLGACTQALLDGGASRVFVVTLARASKEN